MECAQLRNYPFSNATDYLRLQEANYDQIASVGQVCDKHFAPIVSDITVLYLILDFSIAIMKALENFQLNPAVSYLIFNT
jgi:hypothetical protein